MSPLPPSFEKNGFVPFNRAENKISLGNGVYLKPLLIGSDGESDAGKTEFGLSIPGVIKMLSIDRNYRGVMDNPHPPKERNPRVGIRIFQVPMQGTAKIADFQKYYAMIRDAFYDALDCKESTVVLVDGDSDYWEIHVCGYYGKTTQIFPATKYAAPYSDKRAQIARARDSGKIVLCTNKVKDQYVTVYNADGTAKKDDQGNDLRERSGKKERQGFKDQDYLWDLQLYHMFKPAHKRQMGVLPTGKPRMIDVPMQWGVRITKCKHNMEMVGEELWGDDCNFRGLVQLVYPDVPLVRWGFKA